MAAAQASQHNPPQSTKQACANCSSALEGALAPHVCSKCGLPQAVSPGEDYFSAFGVERRFAQDPKALERRFYELSRALHPDRFTTAGPEARQRSLDRMSFVNQAYQTLKNPEELASYLLELEGRKADPKAKTTMPMELAESWFEIQDLLSEDPERAQAKLSGFEQELGGFLKSEESEIARLKATFDSNPADHSSLDAIARKLHSLSYLKSLERDVARMKARHAS